MQGRIGTHALGHMKGRQTDKAALRRLVAGSQMTLRQLADASGVSYSLIRKALKGDRQLSDATATRLAGALGCPVEEFSRRPAEAEAA